MVGGPTFVLTRRPMPDAGPGPITRTMTHDCRIAIVDDHRLFGEALSACLRTVPDFDVVGTGCCGGDALAIAAEREPDILLLDFSMPGGGGPLLEALRDRHPEIAVIILSASDEPDQLDTALTSGVRACVLKGASACELAAVIRAVHKGHRYTRLVPCPHDVVSSFVTECSAPACAAE